MFAIINYDVLAEEYLRSWVIVVFVYIIGYCVSIGLDDLGLLGVVCFDYRSWMIWRAIGEWIRITDLD